MRERWDSTASCLREAATLCENVGNPGGMDDFERFEDWRDHVDKILTNRINIMLNMAKRIGMEKIWSENDRIAFESRKKMRSSHE